MRLRSAFRSLATRLDVALKPDSNASRAAASMGMFCSLASLSISPIMLSVIGKVILKVAGLGFMPDQAGGVVAIKPAIDSNRRADSNNAVAAGVAFPSPFIAT